MHKAGYSDVATLTFPQAVYPSGWWSATLACKDQPLRFTRRADSEAKRFATKYYNAQIHEAAFASAECLQALFRGTE